MLFPERRSRRVAAAAKSRALFLEEPGQKRRDPSRWIQPVVLVLRRTMTTAPPARRSTLDKNALDRYAATNAKLVLVAA
jgi:hypothetical protein